MFCPKPRDLTIRPNVAPITLVTLYPDTKGVVTTMRSVGGAKISPEPEAGFAEFDNGSEGSPASHESSDIFSDFRM